MMFSDAEALLFQSAERALIDVKSIHVATNEMEEILQLLTERDIEHTNNPPLPPTPIPLPRHTLQSNSVDISLSDSLSLSVYHPVCTSTKPSYTQTDPSIYSKVGSLSTYLLITAELPKLPFLT